MTLQDKEVLDESEDVLENVNLIDYEKAEKNIARKLKKDTYKPYVEPEDEIDAFRRKNILAKYDEEIDGPSQDFFRIGQASDPVEKLSKERLEQAISLDLPKLEVASEYYTEEEMKKFKKPKKVRPLKRRGREETFIPDLAPESTSRDHGSRNRRMESTQTSQIVDKDTSDVKVKIEPLDDNTSDFQDESDLEPPPEDLATIVLEEEEAEEEFRKALEKAKKLKLSQTQEEDERKRIEKLIVEREAIIKKEKEEEPSPSSKQGLLVLDATAEFCRNLGDFSTVKVEGGDDIEEDMDTVREEIEPDVESQSDEDMTSDNRGKWNEVDISIEKSADIHSIDPQQPILEEEPDVSVGVAGALKVAMKKGYLDKDDRKPTQGSRQSSLLAAQNYQIEEKFYDDDKIGRRERYNGPVTEFREKMSYKPDVKLEYVDEKGRTLTPKEAFRVLSHKFHGKGPGKNKIDKRMKKLEQEGKLRQMNSTDTPLGTLKLLQDKQKELHTPYVVLSGPSTSLQKN